MQVHLVAASHVVPVARIREKVGLSARIDAGPHERECMLRHTGGVVVAKDDLQLAFQVFGFRQQAVGSVAFGILLRRAHVALTVHHLVVLPVYHRAACHTDFEDVRVRAHEARGHETAEAPAVHTHAAVIYVGQRLEELDALQLIQHFLLAQMLVGDLLELQSAPLAAAVVEHEDEVTQLCHVGLPAAQAPMPAGIYVVGVRPTVHIHHRGIFLLRVEAYGFHHAVVEVSLSVSGLDAATGDFGYAVSLFFPRVGGGEQILGFARCGVQQVDASGHGGTGVAVDGFGAVGIDGYLMHAVFDAEKGLLAVLHAQAVEQAVPRVAFVGEIEQALGLAVEAHEALHFECPGCQARDLHSVAHLSAAGRIAQLGIDLRAEVHQIEVVPAVASRLHDGFRVVPRQKDESVQRFHIFGMRPLHECL